MNISLFAQGIDLEMSGRFGAHVKIPPLQFSEDYPGSIEIRTWDLPFDATDSTLQFTLRPFELGNTDTLVLYFSIQNFDSAQTQIESNASDYTIEYVVWEGGGDPVSGVNLVFPDWHDIPDLYLQISCDQITWDADFFSNHWVIIESNLPNGIAGWLPLRAGNLLEYVYSRWDAFCESCNYEWHVRYQFGELRLENDSTLVDSIISTRWRSGHGDTTYSIVITMDADGRLRSMDPPQISDSPLSWFNNDVNTSFYWWFIGKPWPGDDNIGYYQYFWSASGPYSGEAYLKYGLGFYYETYEFDTDGGGAGLIGGIIDGDTIGTFTQVDIQPESPKIPDSFTLRTYPNPFNRTVSLEFAAPQAGKTGVEIFDLLGRLIYTVEVDAHAGFNHFSWRGVNHAGQSVASGVYLVRLSQNRFVKTAKISLLR
ncbi:MAG: T9SS type A sorting domain-containing protein [Candidatus Marinimicrobia bacterium]|nr:T9SS type A sorting domain-containing protein [Candidatus Neomarinimicrobiota bacterium]